MDETEYKRAFGIDPLRKEVLEKALEHALDIRKFEIDLYWRRATYFWALIAAAFAGYFVILGSQHMVEKKLMAFVVACIGFLFTFAWFQVNRGSKNWQENWENHVDMLEDPVTGPLYKTLLHRPLGDERIEKYITGPASISVSKTNQIVSVFTLVIWLILAYVSLEPLGLDRPLDPTRALVGGITVLFCVLILRKGRTSPREQARVATSRKTTIQR